MKTMFSLILALALTLTACSDSKNARETLRLADRLTCTNPDSALILLTRFDSHGYGPETRAWHALLLAKANEKALKRFHNDSLTAMAADYFRDRGDSLEIQALYYNGVIHGYNKDYANALISLIEAVKKAKTTGDNFYCAMAYREQADIYRSLFVESKHLEYADSARHYFVRAGRPVHAIGEDLSFAEALVSLNRIDSALSVLTSIRKNPEMNDAPAFNAAYHRIMADVRFKRKELPAAICHLDSVEIFANELTSVEWSKKSRIFCETGDFVSAAQALDEARMFIFDAADSAHLSLAEATLAASLCDYRKAYESFTEYHSDIIGSHTYLLSHPYTSIVSDYYKEQSDRRHEELDMTRHNMWMSVTIAVLLAALIIVVIAYYRRRLQEKADQSEILVSDIDRLQKIIDQHTADAAISRSPDMKKMRSERHYSIINSLCELSSCIPDNSDGYAVLGKNVTRLISSLHNDETLNGIETFVNDYFGNIMSRFREQYPDMTERNHRFVMLSFAGFSIQSITTILGLKSAGAARTMRHRIKRQIEEHPSADSGVFISML